MSKLLVIGGSKGIGLAILEEQTQVQSCINFSRTEPSFSGNYEHHAIDILNDELPDLEDVSSIIYCPGSINLKPIGSLKEEDFLEDFNINVLGAVKVIRKYHRQLKRAENASITLFSTVAVERGMAFHASVAASKGAVEGLVKTLAAEFAPKIRVNAIAPTITDTPLAKNLLRNEEMRAKMSDRHPMKRIVQPNEISALVNYLIGRNASSITGQVLTVGGGITSIK